MRVHKSKSQKRIVKKNMFWQNNIFKIFLVALVLLAFSSTTWFALKKFNPDKELEINLVDKGGDYIRSYQIWSDPYNPDNLSCQGVQGCLGLNETTGHLWTFSSSKDRIFDLNKMKASVDKISTGLPYYPDINTDNNTIKTNAMFLFGDIEKSGSSPCVGSACTNEFTLGHCKNNTSTQFTASKFSYLFTNSICGNETVDINFNTQGRQNERYSLLVGWYTGVIPDQIDVYFDGVKRGSIISAANSADVTVIDVNLEGGKTHKLTFKGVSGDGVGLDFMALVPVNYYNTFAIGDDVPTLQFSEFTKDNTLMMIGKDEKSSTHKPCFGSACTDELTAGHCKDIPNNKVYYVNDFTNNFLNSICGLVNGVSKKVSISTDIPQGLYSLVVGWYTGGVEDKVNVKLDGELIGVIETKANTADWTILTLKQKSIFKKHQIQFEGVSGDGFGLDFMALTSDVLYGSHKGFHMFSENGVNTNNDFANKVFYPLVQYVHSKGLKFAVEPFAYPIIWNAKTGDYIIDASKLNNYLRSFIDPKLNEDTDESDPARNRQTDIITLSLDPFAYEYGMSTSEAMDSVIAIAKAVKAIDSDTIVSFDQGNLYRHYCVNYGGNCNFSELEKVANNKRYFDYFIAYGYDFIWESSNHPSALVSYLDNNIYLDYRSIFSSKGLYGFGYQLNPTEGNNYFGKNYHYEVKSQRTIDALNNLYNDYPSYDNLPFLQTSGMNWQQTGQESPTFFLKDNSPGMF